MNQLNQYNLNQLLELIEEEKKRITDWIDSSSAKVAMVDEYNAVERYRELTDLENILHEMRGN